MSPLTVGAIVLVALAVGLLVGAWLGYSTAEQDQQREAQRARQQ